MAKVSEEKRSILIKRKGSTFSVRRSFEFCNIIKEIEKQKEDLRSSKERMVCCWVERDDT